MFTCHSTKNKKPHIVHLSSPALSELAAIRGKQLEQGIQTKFVFTTTGRTAASGVSKAKSRLDDILNSNRAERDEEPIQHWVFHDLRRSQATVLAEAGFSEAVVDRLQNHTAVGSRPSQVAQVYQLADMLTERAQAMNFWSELVTGETEKVVELFEAK